LPRFADVRAAYYEASGTTSDLNRRLGFAAIALIWLFSGGGSNDARQVQIDRDFRLAALLVVVSLATDLAQYVWRTAALGAWTWRTERRTSAQDDDIVTLPRRLNWPTIGLFWLKLLFMAAAYVALSTELSSRLS
jgi:hypothetical protein